MEQDGNMTNTQVNTSVSASEQNNLMTGGMNERKGGNGMVFGMVLCALLAMCGIGFGVYGMMQSSSKDKQISDLKVQIKKDDGTVTTIETPKIETTTEGGTTVTITDTVATDENTEDYIYVGEWGLKIKIPEELSAIGYRFGESSYGEYLVIAGAKTDSSEELFKYTNTDDFHAGLIMKSNSEDGLYPYGTLVYTDSDGNNYYYEGPQADILGPTEEEISAWRAGVDIIKKMVSNPDNYSKI